jgi:hypothetical protein
LPHESGTLVREKSLGLGVHVSDLLVRPDDHHGVWRRIENLSIPVLRSLFRLLAD